MGRQHESAPFHSATIAARCAFIPETPGRILDHLDDATVQQGHYARVCKAWYRPATTSIWRRIRIGHYGDRGRDVPLSLQRYNALSSTAKAGFRPRTVALWAGEISERSSAALKPPRC
ncbi:hypothetical protein M427DRAFT_56566 [Gonapodya prolifera JEL478]|uniref:Uncharacterized protein n=1 Tax=Gonapodya prolifera (strain JEL478) TaxID=1344416 RepID=A0A139AH18_GONPJ|nr:hypothetical protein M427DRAFT_56566 [Gonapodya prolifera JEL478]|eukprot:KXS15735.1 hypothetical protein M427DRAFT_56566 [Gonapodya prolifera JEL478]